MSSDPNYDRADEKLPILECPVTPFSHLVDPKLVEDTIQKGSGLDKGKHVCVLDENHTIKFGPEVTSYEYRILQMLEKVGHIPAPRPLDCFVITVSAHPRGGRRARQKGRVAETWRVIVMSTIPGEVLGTMWTTAGAEAIEAVLKEVMQCLDTINRSIQSGVTFPDSEGVWNDLVMPTSTLSDLDGKKCLQFPVISRLLDTTVRRDDFVQTMNAQTPLLPGEHSDLQFSILEQIKPKARDDSVPLTTLDQQHDFIRFCHMDIHFLNILVIDNKLSGIIDWEFAGWYTPTLDIFSAVSRYSDIPSARLLCKVAGFTDGFTKMVRSSLGIEKGITLYEQHQEKIEREKNPGRRAAQMAAWRAAKKPGKTEKAGNAEQAETAEVDAKQKL